MISIRSPQQIDDALRAARKQLGLRQPQLVLAAGVGVRLIVDLEAGKSTLRLENVLWVIDALGGDNRAHPCRSEGSPKARRDVWPETKTFPGADQTRPPADRQRRTGAGRSRVSERGQDNPLPGVEDSMAIY